MNRTGTLRKRFSRVIRNLAAPIGCGAFFLFLLRFIFFIGYVPSASMEPAIREGSFILGLRIFREPALGDVVVFSHENRLLVKRISGVPGDIVYISGSECTTVPDSCYFMTGDNRGVSYDSRYWSEPFICRKDIIAMIPRHSRQLSKASHFAP